MSSTINRKRIKSFCCIISKLPPGHTHIGRDMKLHRFPSIFFFRDISSVSIDDVLRVKEYIHLITDIIQFFPENITERGWDFIRIAISSWVLTLSKSSAHWKSPKVFGFALTSTKNVIWLIIFKMNHFYLFCFRLPHLRSPYIKWYKHSMPSLSRNIKRVQRSKCCKLWMNGNKYSLKMLI